MDADAGAFHIHIKLKLFGVKVNISNYPLVSVHEQAHLLPICTSPGGHIGDLLDNGTSGGYNLSNKWAFNFFHYNYTINGIGCLNFDSHLGFNGFLSTNFNFHFCTDGLHFCFIPVQSALDYGVLGTNIPLNYNIENQFIDDKLDAVRAAVIIGYPGNNLEANKNHIGEHWEPFRNVEIHNIKGISINPPTSNIYYSCPNNSQDRRGMINLEIGDEELYLENVTLPWSADYESEFDIHVNDRNPYYEYKNYYNSSYNIAGCYSQNYAYDRILSGVATFYVNPAATGIGLNYTAPFPFPFLPYYPVPQTLQNCCIDFTGSKFSIPPSEPSSISYFNIFPNPNNGNQLLLNYRFTKMGKVYIEMFSMLGEKIFSKVLNVNDATSETNSMVYCYCSGGRQLKIYRATFECILN